MCKNPKKHRLYKKNCIWNPVTCSYKNGKYVRSIIEDSAVVCGEIIEETKTVPTKSTSTKIVLTKCTSTNLHTLLAFLLIITALLIAVSIYCYLIKYQAKQKHLLPCHYTINDLKEIGY